MGNRERVSKPVESVEETPTPQDLSHLNKFDHNHNSTASVSKRGIGKVEEREFKGSGNAEVKVEFEENDLDLALLSLEDLKKARSEERIGDGTVKESPRLEEKKLTGTLKPSRSWDCFKANSHFESQPEFQKRTSIANNPSEVQILGKKKVRSVATQTDFDSPSQQDQKIVFPTLKSHSRSSIYVSGKQDHPVRMPSPSPRIKLKSTPKPRTKTQSFFNVRSTQSAELGRLPAPQPQKIRQSLSKFDVSNDVKQLEDNPETSKGREVLRTRLKSFGQRMRLTTSRK